MDASGAADESAILRTAKSCGPDASMVGVKLAMMLRITPMMVTTKPDHQGEREISRKAVACGNAGCPGELVVTNACAFYTSRTRLRVQRAPGIPRSLLGVAPLPPWGSAAPFVGRIVQAQLGRIMPRERGVVSRRHCEERSGEAIHSCFLLPHGLLRGACHRAALCADPLARNDDLKTPRALAV
jgi:hypothetical protein